MNNLRRFGILSLFITTVFLFACDGGGSSSSGDGTGTLAVSLTDSSCSTYKAIYVTIDEVQVNKNDASTSGNSGWETVATPTKTYNLYSLVNGVTEVLGQEDLLEGTYKQIRLIIGTQAESEDNINGDPHPDANYVLFNDDTYESLKIPSGFKTGVKLVHNFVVAEGSYVELVLDFEACNSVVETGGGKYLLKPTIKIIETVDKTEVYGTVSDADTKAFITHASVSAQITDGQSVSIARSTVTSNETGEEGQYSLFLSPDQTYHVVVYSDEEVVDGLEQKLYTPTCQLVTEPKQVLEQKFSLAKSSIGTISGDVTVSGDIDANDPPVVHISFFSLLPLPCDAYVEVTNLVMSPDADGNFSYSINLPYGIYDVVASSQGYIPDTAPDVTLNSSHTSVVDVDLDL
ncbi:MAG: DUF4382 domain-containing protein [Nitrospinales bacterium]